MLEKTHIKAIDSFPERDNKKRRVFEGVKMSVCILCTIKESVESVDGNKNDSILRVWDDRHMAVLKLATRF